MKKAKADGITRYKPFEARSCLAVQGRLVDLRRDPPTTQFAHSGRLRCQQTERSQTLRSAARQPRVPQSGAVLTIMTKRVCCSIDSRRVAECRVSNQFLPLPVAAPVVNESVA